MGSLQPGVDKAHIGVLPVGGPVFPADVFAGSIAVGNTAQPMLAEPVVSPHGKAAALVVEPFNAALGSLHLEIAQSAGPDIALEGERKRAVSRCSSPVPVKERRVAAEESMELAMLLP